jgi:hypothetical protein
MYTFRITPVQDYISWCMKLETKGLDVDESAKWGSNGGRWGCVVTEGEVRVTVRRGAGGARGAGRCRTRRRCAPTSPTGTAPAPLCFSRLLSPPAASVHRNHHFSITDFNFNQYLHYRHLFITIYLYIVKSLSYRMTHSVILDLALLVNNYDYECQ